MREALRGLARRATGGNAYIERVWSQGARGGADSQLLRLPSGGHPPIQDLDPGSATFGLPYFVLGLDELGGEWVLR